MKTFISRKNIFGYLIKENTQETSHACGGLMLSTLHMRKTTKYFFQQINEIPLALWDSLPIIIHCTPNNANKLPSSYGI